MEQEPRRCGFCGESLPEDLAGQARYCSRAHRQRAYEARQDQLADRLRRRVHNLEEQVAAYQRCLDRLSEDPAHAEVVAEVVMDEVGGLLRDRRLARDRRRSSTI